MSILLLDSCESLRELCSMILEEAGYRTYATNEFSFLKDLSILEPNTDLVIINSNPLDSLPTINTYLSLRGINPDVPVLLLTVNWYDEAIHSLIAQGCAQLAVPFDNDQFIEKVSNLCSVALSHT